MRRARSVATSRWTPSAWTRVPAPTSCLSWWWPARAATPAARARIRADRTVCRHGSAAARALDRRVWAVRGDALAGHRPASAARAGTARRRPLRTLGPAGPVQVQPGVPARHRRGPVHAACRAAAVAGGSGGQAGHGGLRRCRARVPGAAGASQQASPPVGGAHLRQPAAKRGKPVWIGLLLALVIVGGTFGWFQSGRAPNALITSSELMPPNPPMVRPEAPAQPSAPQAEPQVARAEPPGCSLRSRRCPCSSRSSPAAVADAAPPSTEALIGAARSLDNSAFQAEPAVPAQPQEEPSPGPSRRP